MLINAQPLAGENALPVLLHVHDRPALSLGLVECLVEPSDVRGTVVGPLALGVGVVHEAHEARTATRDRPLQHLVVTVGVAESEQRPLANIFVNTDQAGAPGRVLYPGLPSRRTNSFCTTP